MEILSSALQCFATIVYAAEILLSSRPGVTARQYVLETQSTVLARQLVPILLCHYIFPLAMVMYLCTFRMADSGEGVPAQPAGR